MKRVFEILAMITLLIWGAVFLYFFFSERVDNYLSKSFRIWVPLAGVGMIILGVCNLVNVNRSTGTCTHDHAHGDHDHHDCDHDHDHGEDEPHVHDETTASSLAFALVILLVPLLTAARFSPDRFSGAYTKKWAEIEMDMQKMRQRRAKEASQKMSASENPYAAPGSDQSSGGEGAGQADSSSGGEAWGEFTLEDLKKMVPQTSAGDFLLDVPQIFYTAGDEELMRVMEGISIETVAQVIEETSENAPSNRLRAYRLLIECCAADARPLSIPIDFAESVPEYTEMGWYKLVGRLHFHEGENHEYTPILQIKSFQETPEPADWMAIY